MTTYGLPPGPKLPAVLQLANWVYRPLPFMRACARRYGECFTLRLPNNPPIVFFSDPEAIKEIFTGDPEKMPAGESRAILRPLVGQHSLLLLDGARHRQQRRLMMPPFHGERMHAYGEVMRTITDHAIDHWPSGRPFPLQPEMQAITLEVILRTVFGVDEGAALTQLRDRLTELLTLSTNPLRLALSQFPRLQFLFRSITNPERLQQLLQEVDDLLYAQIAQRRAAGGAGREDVLTMLIEARDDTGQHMSDVELRDELITLLVAGHETTATSLSWAFHWILQRADVQDKLHAELRQAGEPGRVPPQQIAKLDYLDAVIKETQRLLPIIPLVPRVLRAPMRLGGRDLPVGVVVAPCTYLTHHRPDLWPNPDQFDPEHFLGKRPSAYEFFPFGGGIRHCLGAAFAVYEMKIVLAQVLSRVVLRPAPGHTVRVVRRGVTFAPSAGMPVVLERLAA
ncbi:MAG TPA: cytochrome P450 [Methylomirabilota bacterium]|nr:cytochrome P450 [Methylomirabilota bacterium]